MPKCGGILERPKIKSGIPENPSKVEISKMERILSGKNGKVRVIGLFGNLISEYIKRGR